MEQFVLQLEHSYTDPSVGDPPYDQITNFAKTSQSRAHCRGRRRVQQVRAACNGLVARAALPNARHRALDRILATKHAKVLGVLRNFNLLHDFTERRAVAGAVLATDANFFRALALHIHNITRPGVRYTENTL